MRTFMHMGVRLTILIGLAAQGASVSAQTWNVSAQAGRMRSALDPSLASSTLALGLDYDAPTAGFRLSSGIPTSSVESLWAGAAAWKRAVLRFNGIFAGIDLAGNAFVSRDRSNRQTGEIPGPFDPPLESVADLSGHALAGQALPVIGYESGGFGIHARAGVSYYSAQFGDVESDRTVRLAEVQLTFAPAASIALLPVVRRYDAADEEPATYAGVSAVLAQDRVSVWGSVGHWLDADGVDLPWAVGGSLRVHPRASIDVSARHDAFDPLYMQPATTSWDVALSVQVGGPVGPPPAPVPARYVDGRATIRLPADDSPTTPSVAGDFNDWKPVAMRRDGDHWSYTVALEPGVYNYAFVSADGTWFVPESVPGRKDDGMGGHVAVLVVE